MRHRLEHTNRLRLIINNVICSCTCISFCSIVFTVSFILMLIYYHCYCYLIRLLFLLDVECRLRLHSTLARIALTILDLHVQVLKTGARKLIQLKRTYATLRSCQGNFSLNFVQAASSLVLEAIFCNT